MSAAPVDITFLLDRSGSMRRIAEATIQGFNQFLKDRQQADGEGRMTLVQFNDKGDALYLGIPVREIVPLDAASYRPWGNTALLDALGWAVEQTKARLAVAGGARKVVFVVLTDGVENASRHYSRSQVFDMITRQREQHGWEFLFLGANQDAIGEAGKVGIDWRSASNFEASAKGDTRCVSYGFRNREIVRRTPSDGSSDRTPESA